MANAKLEPASIMDSIEAYAIRLGSADRLGLPSGGLGRELDDARAHWSGVLRSPDAVALRERYAAAYRRARGDDSTSSLVSDEETVDVTTAPPTLSLEQHAAYTAELSLWPADAARIHARYGLGDGGRRVAELRYWAGARARDAALDAKWLSLLQAYSRYYATR